jgi:hypothetical protein
VIAIVVSFEVHRRQIMFDALDTETGEVSRGRIDATAPAVDDVVTVSVEEILAAMRLLFERLKTVAELSGASALSAVIASRVEISAVVRVGVGVGVTISGGERRRRSVRRAARPAGTVLPTSRGRDMSANLASILTETAERRPDAVAYKLDDVEVSFKAVDEGSARVAGLLKAKGLEPGDRVGIMLPNVPYFPIAC